MNRSYVVLLFLFCTLVPGHASEEFNTHTLTITSADTWLYTDCAGPPGRRDCVPACKIASTFRSAKFSKITNSIVVEIIFNDPIKRNDDKTISRGFVFKTSQNKNRDSLWVEGLKCSQISIKNVSAECERGAGNICRRNWVMKFVSKVPGIYYKKNYISIDLEKS